MQNTYICLILGIVLFFKGINGTKCYQTQQDKGRDPAVVECPPNTIGCLHVQIWTKEGTISEKQEDIRKGFLTKMLKCFINCMIGKAMYKL